MVNVRIDLLVLAKKSLRSPVSLPSGLRFNTTKSARPRFGVARAYSRFRLAVMATRLGCTARSRETLGASCVRSKRENGSGKGSRKSNPRVFLPFLGGQHERVSTWAGRLLFLGGMITNLFSLKLNLFSGLVMNTKIRWNRSGNV